VQNLCDTVVVMKDGVIVERGTTADVLLHPQHEYTKALLAAIPVIPSRDR
jgi:ABC-type dipeptide/oligopeptide/nickel transport system ATPase component